jgi:hypothetical protein
MGGDCLNVGCVPSKVSMMICPPSFFPATCVSILDLSLPRTLPQLLTSTSLHFLTHRRSFGPQDLQASSAALKQMPMDLGSPLRALSTWTSPRCVSIAGSGTQQCCAPNDPQSVKQPALGDGARAPAAR